MPTLLTIDLQLLVELDESRHRLAPILVPTGIRMARLHDMIQAAMGWTNSHLHAYTSTAHVMGCALTNIPRARSTSRL